MGSGKCSSKIQPGVGKKKRSRRCQNGEHKLSCWKPTDAGLLDEGIKCAGSIGCSGVLERGQDAVRSS